jgi:hypothetical protein
LLGQKSFSNVLSKAGTLEVISMNAPTKATDSALSPIAFTVNGHPHRLELDLRTSLLDALREHLRLTGTKKGCDHGQCGACTVLINGRRINSCLTLAVMHDLDDIVTIEGLGTPEALYPLAAAASSTAAVSTTSSTKPVFPATRSVRKDTPFFFALIAIGPDKRELG